MSTSPDSRSVSDVELAEACASGSDEAWTTLLARMDIPIRAVALRVADERGRTAAEAYADGLAAIGQYLKRNDFGLLRMWSETHCTLKHYIVVLARRAMVDSLKESDARLSFMPTMPSPAAEAVSDLLASGPAARVNDILGRLPSNLMAAVRLSLRGADIESIGKALAKPPQMVRRDLTHVADRLGASVGHDPDIASTCFRYLLDVSTPAERVNVARQTEQSRAFRNIRGLVDNIWRDLREIRLATNELETPLDLDAMSVAGFVDGKLRGVERIRVEGNLASSPRSIDEVAMLSMDMRAVEIAQHHARKDRDLALATACLCTGHYSVAAQLASNVTTPDWISETLADLANLGRSLKSLDETPEGPFQSHEPLARVLVHLRSAEPELAGELLDQLPAQGPLIERMVLLTQAAGLDIGNARTLAEQTLDKARLDELHREDCETVLASPADAPMPAELVAQRLGALLPLAAQTVANGRRS